jgi:hypothetical protein
MPVKPTNPVINRSHPLARGLVGAWAFQDGGGSTLRDVSWRGNHGTLTNMDPATDWVTSRYGGALDFDGSNDYASVPQTSSLAFTTSMSIECLVKLDTTSGAQCIVDSRHTDNSGFYLFCYSHVAPISFVFGMSTGGTADNLTTTPVVSGVWYHLIGTWDGATSRVYLDGVLEGSMSKTGTMTVSTAPLRIGYRHTNNYPLNGQVSLARLWDRPLSPSEVMDLYVSGNDLYSPAVGVRERYYVALPSAGQPAFKRWGQRTNQPIFGRGF